MNENLLDELGYKNTNCPEWIYATLVVTKAKIHYARVEWLHGAPRAIKATSLDVAGWGPEAMIEVWHQILNEINANDFYLQEIVIGSDFKHLDHMAPLLFMTQMVRPEVDIVIIDKDLPKALLELGDIDNLDEYYSNKFPAFFQKAKGITRKVIIEACIAHEWATG